MHYSPSTSPLHLACYLEEPSQTCLLNWILKVITNLRLPLPRAALTRCQMLEQRFSIFFFFSSQITWWVIRKQNPGPHPWVLDSVGWRDPGVCIFNKLPLILRLLVQEKHPENPASELKCDFFQARPSCGFPGEGGASSFCASGMAVWENAHVVEYQHGIMHQPPAKRRGRHRVGHPRRPDSCFWDQGHGLLTLTSRARQVRFSHTFSRFWKGAWLLKMSEILL